MPKDYELPPKTKNPRCWHKNDTPVRRNLVVMIDSKNWKIVGPQNTNIMELYNIVDKDDTQLVWRDSGDGPYSRPSWGSPAYWKTVIHSYADLAFSWDFKEIVLEAYKWLSENYQQGDRIFLFGFARGAYQARVLSAMISKVGLMNKGNELQISFAYELYANSDKNAPELDAAGRFKRAFGRRDVKVHFVGVWDTISFNGILRSKIILPGVTDGMKHACFFRHALALDEFRARFDPQFAYGGNGVPEEDRSGKIPRIKEVWFSGTHPDIGGSSIRSLKLILSLSPLYWMILEAGPLGLRTKQLPRELLYEPTVAVRGPSLGLWWLFEYLPMGRLNTTMPHMGQHRKIQPGQKIHLSVMSRSMDTPKASPPAQDGLEFWKTLKSAVKNTQEQSELHKTWIEDDFYDNILRTVYGLINTLGPDMSFEMLRDVSERYEGKRTLYDAVMTILADGSVTREIKNLIMKKCIEILDLRSFLSRRRYFEVVVSNIQGLETEEGKVDPFIKQFLFHFCHFSYHSTILQEDNGSKVFSVAFSSDGKKLISGSSDATVYIWNGCGTCLGHATNHPLIGHKSSVFSVAISPDERNIISASKDGTLRLWDMEKGTQVGIPWKGHTGAVNCAAFSKDGKRVVSCSDDGTIRIWDVEKGTQVEESLTGHQAGVQSIAFSPDHTLLVSGSDDHTLRIWNVDHGHQVGVPLEGHTDHVLSLVFSSNGKRILSGSRDMTVRIWDVATHRQIGPRIPVRASVRSICSSPDDKLLFFGTDDNTVWIWDAETGKQMGERLRGHSRPVACVACSPDGKSIVSASLDGTIRIWDIETHVAWSKL